MNSDQDRLFRELAGLPQVEPRFEWETRVRARCHAAIVGRASKRARAERNRFRAGIFELVAAASLSLYLAAVFMEAAAMLR